TTKKAVNAGIGNLFDRENYKWMLIGVAVILLGWILMAGGASKDPNVFNKNEVYSTVRITIAPIVIVAGLIIEIYALLKSSNTPQP
ncbi:MAG TPA: DUF3098 domain-containing protein, partial [Flavisolibacter sp.]|nr:DUF3098 domain-containing protein [Flavisolibacter sp.]